MNARRWMIAAAAAAALGTGTAYVGAASTTETPPGYGPGMMGQHRGMMMNQGMMGCPMMSGGTMGGGGMMGGRMMMLPPGNEKLQMQMQAEMMQKMGEIMAKYANQVQTR